MEPAIKIIGKDNCTGCAGCANSCIHNAINLKLNIEGFLIPFQCNASWVGFDPFGYQAELGNQRISPRDWDYLSVEIILDIVYNCVNLQ